MKSESGCAEPVEEGEEGHVPFLRSGLGGASDGWAPTEELVEGPCGCPGLSGFVARWWGRRRAESLWRTGGDSYMGCLPWGFAFITGMPFIAARVLAFGRSSTWGEESWAIHGLGRGGDIGASAFSTPVVALLFDFPFHMCLGFVGGPDIGLSFIFGHRSFPDLVDRDGRVPSAYQGVEGFFEGSENQVVLRSTEVALPRVLRPHSRDGSVV